MELPGGRIERLTSNSHAETYPRISPDGRQVVFARSQPPWVSQRNPIPWDAWAVDLASGAERLVARGANAPFWSDDGGTVYFQRNGGEFVSHDLATGGERVLFRAGAAPVPAGTNLETPDYDASTGRLVATLRGAGAPRITALMTAAGKLEQLGGGGDCQVAWSRGRRGLFFVGHGGRQQNALYTLVPGERPKLWLDLPGALSHEYFPRQSPDGRFLVFAASAGGREHEHDAGDYELFLWRIGDPAESAVRLTWHTGNDSWPDIFLLPE
jgi:Tol biopolymer transport system component